MEAWIEEALAARGEHVVAVRGGALLASAARRGLPPEPLVEAYLDAWNGLGAGGDADARAALDAATRLAAIQRFDLWIHIGAVTPRDQVEEWVPYARPLLRQIGAPLAELSEF